MFKKLAISLTAVSALGLAGCGTINDGADGIGLNVEFTDVYAETGSFEERAFATVRLYEATLDQAIAACDTETNPDAANTPIEVCEAAADAAEKISPAVQVASRSIGVYIYLDNKVDQIRADGEVVPDEILTAAADAFFKARAEWAAIEQDIQVYVGQ